MDRVRDRFLLVAFNRRFLPVALEIGTSSKRINQSTLSQPFENDEMEGKQEKETFTGFKLQHQPHIKISPRRSVEISRFHHTMDNL